MNIKKNIDLFLTANRKVLKQIFRNKLIHTKIVDYNNLYTEVHEKASPCFVLSTGRCGTHLLTKLLALNDKFQVYHEPVPSLIYYSKFAFENNDTKYDEIKTAIDAARYEYIRDSYLLGLQFVETNNRITFFASQLSELYPKAKFIHLVRNPLTFVKSGLNRDWYTGKNSHDEGRIRLKGNEWGGFTNTQKIAWLWENTNQFIESFKQKIVAERIITIRSEDLFKDVKYAESLFEFLESPMISRDKIEKVIGKPTNVSRGNKSSLTDDEFVEQIKPFLTLTEKYDYKLNWNKK